MDDSIIPDVTIPKGEAEGMIVTMGGRFGGYGLYLLEGMPVFDYKLLDLTHCRREGSPLNRELLSSALKPGTLTIVFNFKYEGPGPGKDGTGLLTVDGNEVARKSIPHTIPLLMSINETFDVGIDGRTAVNNDYARRSASPAQSTS